METLRTPTTGPGEPRPGAAPGAPAGRRSRTALPLLAGLVLCLPPLLVDLTKHDIARIMENISLASSQETWLRMHGWRDTDTIWQHDNATLPGGASSWLVPSFNGRPRLAKPPMLVWVNMLAWSGCAPGSTDPQALVLRARLTALIMTMLVIAATYWIGLSLGGVRLATTAALALGCVWFVQRQGRTSSYDIHVTAWATLAIAAALSAARLPAGHDPPGHAWWRWGLAGVCLAAAWLTKGPLALVLVLLPLAAMVMVMPHRRRFVLGVLALLAIAAALALPWFIYVNRLIPDAMTSWLHEARAQRDYFKAPYYNLNIFGLVLPWPLWLVAGLVHPFMFSDTAERRQRLVAWLWLASLWVFFSIPAAKQQRYLLPLMPSAALLIAMVFLDHHRDAARRDRGWRVLVNVHWPALLVVSVLCVPVFAGGDGVDQLMHLNRAKLAPMPWVVAGVLGAALVWISVAGWRLHRRGNALAAAGLTALWALALTTATWHSLDTAVAKRDHAGADGERVARAVGDAPLSYLNASREDHAHLFDSEEFIFYLRRIVPGAEPQDLPAIVASGRAWVMARQTEYSGPMMRRAGFEPVLEFRAEPRTLYTLWRVP